ncbi:MAG: radical SAM family heme chaperone HemW [Treponema sp.]|nr:radical SAM family heme chaperone HemW [Treponema sp.]
MSCKEISLYIHIPFCVSKCDYCDFFSIPVGSKNNAVSLDYIDSLCNEIKSRLKQYENCLLKTVYIGGGTPSLLSAAELNKITDVLKEYGFTSDYEFTFEVNPDDVSKELLLALEAAGVNRISCGIQSFSEDVLKSVHRRSNSSQNYECFKLFDHFWHKKLSVDLICGLPGETEESLIHGLNFLTEQKIPHISFYSLCVEEETPLGKAIITDSESYDYDFSDELWLKGRDFLISKGYEQYEVSNFCLKGYECLHNMTYWTHKDYIGCGSGAAGTLYRQPLENDFRYTNTKNIKEYIDFWHDGLKTIENAPQNVEKITLKDSEFEYFMMGLRTVRGVSCKEFEAIFNKKMPEKILNKLKTECTESIDGFYYLDSKKLLFLNKFLEEIYEIINTE